MTDFEKFSERLVYDLKSIIKAKWMKLVFLFQAYYYCKTKGGILFKDLNFIKSAKGALFTDYDQRLNKLEQNDVLGVNRWHGYQMNITTLLHANDDKLKPSFHKFKDKDKEETYLKVLSYFKDKNPSFITDFILKMSIYKEGSVWMDLDFEKLFKDDPNIVEFLA